MRAAAKAMPPAALDHAGMLNNRISDTGNFSRNRIRPVMPQGVDANDPFTLPLPAKATYRNTVRQSGSSVRWAFSSVMRDSFDVRFPQKSLNGQTVRYSESSEYRVAVASTSLGQGKAGAKSSPHQVLH